MAANLHLPEEFASASMALTAHCFCKAAAFSITVPTSALPLPVHLCHCSVCRYIQGTPCSFHAALPKGVGPNFTAPLSEVLTSYTPKNGLSERFFCKRCGCHVGDVDVKVDKEGLKEWRVSSSLFEDHSERVFQIRNHIYTESSPGGGIFSWLPKIGERQLTVWNPTKDALPAQDGAPIAQAKNQEGMGDRLLAECHCGGVSFSIPRPNIPEIKADEHLRKLASPLDERKWIGSIDLCDDCRLCDGTHVQTWVSIPLAHTSPRIPADFNFGTMEVFESSPGVRRTFCGICGATVFWESEEEAPTEAQMVVDLVTGILRAPDGVIARDWLTWRTGRVAWESDGEKYDPSFCQGLKEGLEDWGVSEYGHSPTFPQE